MTPEIAIGLVTALGLGALVGIERQWRQRSSGMATHAMVALGAASFSILPLLLDNEVSVTRMAAQVVSGIGFLGAGVIMRDGLSVRGLSTAASIWSTGAIGVLAGSGFILAACMTTALIVIANLFLPALGRVVDRHTSGEAEQERFYQISVSCEARNEALVRMQLLQRMGDNRLNLQSLESHALKGSGNVEVNAVVFTLHKEDSLVEQMVGELCLAPQVTAASWVMNPAAE
ncbi:MgtC/SapB family protein [Pseudomonas aeruginosa]|nr:MgtC/SapB family protein [Pseudomonas aeruginosa]